MPEINSMDELMDHLQQLIDQEHDYNTSAEALHDGTVACFNFLAGELGNSGFQASWAVLKFLGTVNYYEGPYAVIKASDRLYPQYSNRIDEILISWNDWIKEQAQENLDDHPDYTHPDVIAHWKRIVDA